MASKYQTKVIKALEKHGYIVINTIKLSKSGYPDLIALKKRKAEFIEVKEANDKISPLQKHRIIELINNDFKACCLQDQKGVIFGIPSKKLTSIINSENL